MTRPRCLIAWLFVLQLTLLGSCSNFRTISSRPLLVDPAGMVKAGRHPLRKQRSEQLYAKRRKVKITEKKASVDTGSLFVAANAKNDFYGAKRFDQLGRILDVAIVVSEDPRQSKDQGEKEASGDKAASSEDELISEFPELSPPKGKKRRLKSSLRMEIVQNFPNGDVLLAYRRSSDSDRENVAIVVEARLPYRSLADNTVSSSDLYDISLVQHLGRDTIVRKSSGWEDEYTLRVSEFREAASQEALELETKRQHLKKLRQRMLDRLKSANRERQRSANEGEKLRKENSRIAKQIKDLQETIEAQRKEIQDKSSQLSPTEEEEKLPQADGPKP